MSLPGLCDQKSTTTEDRSINKSWKNGDVIGLTGRYRGRMAIVFYVSKAAINDGVNARRPGFYAFSQLTKHGDAFNFRDYGKIYEAVGRRHGRLRKTCPRRLEA